MKICPNCNQELLDEAVFCPNCKYTFQNNHNITIMYCNDIYLYKPKITITIDNQNQYVMHMGDRLDAILDEGSHKIFIKMGVRKKECNINLIHDVKLKIEANRVTGGIDLSEMK